MEIDTTPDNSKIGIKPSILKVEEELYEPSRDYKNSPTTYKYGMHCLNICITHYITGLLINIVIPGNKMGYLLSLQNFLKMF